MDFKVASNILRKAWLIEPQAANSYLDLLEQMKSGTGTFKKDKDEEAQIDALVKLFGNADVVVAPTDTWSARSHQGYEGKSIGILPVTGPLMKEDFCGWFGTTSMRNEIKKMNATQSIHTIIFLFDTPGGTVDGTEVFANEIKNSEKDTIGLIDGMVCSAGYWAASACDTLIGTSKTDMIGSIGTMISFYDQSARLAEMGIVLREYYATESRDKNKSFRDAKNGDGKLLIEELLDPTNDIFLNAVRENRSGVKLNEKAVFTGKVYLAEDALKYGLIDEISSMDETIKNILQNKNSVTMKIGAAFKNVLTFLGFSSSTEEVELTQEQLAKIDAVLPELETSRARVTELEAAATEDKSKITALEDKNITLSNDVTAKENKITELTAEVARLGALDGAKITTTTGQEEKKEAPVVELSESQKALNEKIANQ